MSNLYDVELKVTIRLEAAHVEDARLQAFLMGEECLYGGVMVTAGLSPSQARARVDERAEETGITLQVTDCERVVTPRPYSV
jgi:hypothetical protein